MLSLGQRVHVLPERQLAVICHHGDGKVVVSFPGSPRRFGLLPLDAVEAAPDPPGIVADRVRRGDVIGLDNGLSLRVQHIDFDGDEGLLAGRIETVGDTDGWHGPLRVGQPYAVVVDAQSVLHLVQGVGAEMATF